MDGSLLWRLTCFLPPTVKPERTATPPPAVSKPALSEEEMEKKSTAIIEEYIQINDLKVHAWLCPTPTLHYKTPHVWG